jgi:hypothetical protein
MRRAAFALAFAAVVMADVALAQGMILSIEINRSNPAPRRPTAAINTLQEFMAALAACWEPPSIDERRGPVDLTFQVSFKRSGELFGKPRIVNFARAVTDQERQRYYTSIAEAIDRCSPMPFTASMGGAVAGRTFRVNFLDRRNSRKAEAWLKNSRSKPPKATS